MSSEDGTETARRTSSSTVLVGSGQDMSSHKESLNAVQAMCKFDFWLLFLAMACGMGSGLTTVNYVSQIRGSLWLDEQGDHHPGVALEHLELLWEVRCRLRLQSLPLVVRSRQAFFIAATLLVMGVGHTIISSGFRASVYIGSGFQRHFCDKESPQGMASSGSMTRPPCANREDMPDKWTDAELDKVKDKDMRTPSCWCGDVCKVKISTGRKK
ncbi:hypothetical protein VPH35_138871 [Triticum aestivum]